MPLEQDSLPLPSGSPAIASELPGITEEQAGAKIAQLLKPKPPRAADGKFQPVNPRPEPADGQPGAEADDEIIAPEPDEAAPAEAAPEDDGEIEIDDGTDAEPKAPSVDMPESWGKTAADIWSALPPEAQTFLKQHEAKRTQGITRQLNELKAEQEKVQTASQALEQQQLQITQAAARFADKTVQKFLNDFADLKSPEDVVKLSVENPARYLQYDAALKAAQSATQESQELERAQREKTLKSLQEFRVEQNAKIVELMGLTDEASATAFEKRLTDYTSKFQIPRERLAQYRAEEILMAEKARKWDEAVAKRDAARKSANPPPPVLRPGAPSSSRQLVAQAREKQLTSNLRKTGSEADAAAVIKSRLFSPRRK